MSKIIGGSAFGKGDSLLDVTGAALLDDVAVCVVGDLTPSGVKTIIALELGGRVNKTTERSETLYLMNVGGAASIISELLGVASRADPHFLEQLLERIEKLPRHA